MKIVYTSPDVTIIDKPSGMVVNNAESVKVSTVQDWAKGHLGVDWDRCDQESDFVKRNGVVHRLDKETSGLLILAKTERAFEDLQLQFKERNVQKKYIALVHGNVKLDRGVIADSVGRLPWNREKFGILDDGKIAETEYEVIERFEHRPSLQEVRRNPGLDLGYSLVRFLPKTGRTHQIRVHAKAMGHPVVGDQMYAGRKTAMKDREWCPRIFLHAYYLCFWDESVREQKEVEISIDEMLVDVISKLRSNVGVNA